MPIIWKKDLNTGIDIIDGQHMRIMDYINQVEDAHQQKNRVLVGQTLNDCVDYTVSHFAFEESLQEEAGYRYCVPHKKVHGLFTRRIQEYQTRFASGEDIGGELYDLLSRWLINHIKNDDADYVAAVKDNMNIILFEKEKNEKKGWIKRFFK